MVGQSVKVQVFTALVAVEGVALIVAVEGVGESIAEIVAPGLGVGWIVALGEDIGEMAVSDIEGDGSAVAAVVNDQSDPPLSYTVSPMRIWK